MEILSPEPPKQLNISLSDSSSGDDSDFDTMRNKCKFSIFFNFAFFDKNFTRMVNF